MRIYDPRIGRFLSVDPLTRTYPWYTPYQFAGNRPIDAIDLDGAEPQGFMEHWRTVIYPYHTKWNFTVKTIYDSKTKQQWTIMHYPNTDEYYYYDPKFEGAARIFDPYNLKLNKAGTEWTGRFRQFIPSHLSDDKSFDYLMAGVIVAPFVAVETMGAAVGAGGAALTEMAGDAMIKAYMWYWRYAPQAGIIGRVAAEFVDETGSIGLQNSQIKRFAFGIGPNAINLAEKIGGDHLMGSQQWKDDFLNIASDVNSELHFDLTDISLDGKINAQVIINIVNTPLDNQMPNTHWEISTLFNNYLDKFKQTIFHYKGKEYKGTDIFEINE